MDPGDVRVIGGNGEPLELRGFAVLPVSHGTTLLLHEFGVVPRLPMEILMGADFMVPHQCTLYFLKENQKKLQLGLKYVCNVVLTQKRPRGRNLGTNQISRLLPEALSAPTSNWSELHSNPSKRGRCGGGGRHQGRRRGIEIEPVACDPEALGTGGTRCYLGGSDPDTVGLGDLHLDADS